VLYADRGFYSVEVVKLLQAYTIPFVIGARKNKNIRSYLETFPKTGKITSVPYTMKSGQGETNYRSYVACLLAPKAERLVCLYQLDDLFRATDLRLLSSVGYRDFLPSSQEH